ncbi:MAG: Hsp70 family protein, partial [Thermomicrobiales bacterium]|nr:Hsp70 family protein [Thermomicrobiales bacterium]
DANGILNVTAKDQATGKEQKITITGSSGLSESEVQRMVQEAESHAEEDRQRREAISLRNDAESMSHQAENTLKEYGDRIPQATKTDLEARLADVQDILKNDPTNADRLRPAYEAMVSVLTQAGTAMYEQAAASNAGGEPGGGAAPGSGSDDEETVDAEFREVGGEDRA